MKNSTYLFLLIVAGIIFCSCATNSVSVTKRRYRDGYYVEYGKGRHNRVQAPEVKEEPHALAPAIAKEPSAKATSSPSRTPGKTLAPAAAAVKEKTCTQGKKDAARSAEKLKKDPRPRTDLSNALAPLRVASEDPFSALNRHLATQPAPGPHSDEALSLIWIIILVVLILWLLGYLGGGWGIGGAIHLLLVIALVLLILWLLRII